MKFNIPGPPSLRAAIHEKKTPPLKGLSFESVKLDEGAGHATQIVKLKPSKMQNCELEKKPH